LVKIPLKSPADCRKFVLEIQKGRDEADRTSKEFIYGCRFGPLENPREYAGEVESYKSARLNCYQLRVNLKKHSTKVLTEFGDTVTTTSRICESIASKPSPCISRRSLAERMGGRG
jgi:hypothetical protein